VTLGRTAARLRHALASWCVGCKRDGMWIFLLSASACVVPMQGGRRLVREGAQVEHTCGAQVLGCPGAMPAPLSSQDCPQGSACCFVVNDAGSGE
jgi:hypothetical protein